MASETRYSVTHFHFRISVSACLKLAKNISQNAFHQYARLEAAGVSVNSIMRVMNVQRPGNLWKSEASKE